jgi:hypothetical protein
MDRPSQNAISADWMFFHSDAPAAAGQETSSPAQLEVPRGERRAGGLPYLCTNGSDKLFIMRMPELETWIHAYLQYEC